MQASFECTEYPGTGAHSPFLNIDNWIINNIPFWLLEYLLKMRLVFIEASGFIENVWKAGLRPFDASTGTEHLSVGDI